MYVVDFTPKKVQVGYGNLGLNGSLGYEGKQVIVRDQLYRHALSTHPPARVLYHLERRFSGFHCEVALNDDVAPGISHADFIIMADGRQVAVASHVVAGEPPRSLSADISGAEYLELVAKTSRWEYCHAVWLDPQVEETAVVSTPDTLIDCLSRVSMKVPAVLPKAERCVATVVSPGFEGLLDDMLGSFHANSGCTDTLIVVFAVGESEACNRVIAKYQATQIQCQPRARLNVTVKSALYSVARVVDAEQFLCLDADVLVLGDLRPVFAAIDAFPEGRIFACREGNGYGYKNLGHVLCTAYAGKEADLDRLSGKMEHEGAYPLVVNDGIFAGSRASLLALDGAIRAIPEAARWVDEHRNILWRNQFVFNLALARLQCGVELDPIYNIQLHVQDVQFTRPGGRPQAVWNGRAVRVLHFSGNGRRKYPQLRNIFACVSDPLVGAKGGDNYGKFLTALRSWLGRHGIAGLTWSFYGTSDGQSARVLDPSTLPLLGLLHYLIRSNGCVRVLETGTARGISAACLASAVAHRTGGCVLTLDPNVYPERIELWAELPDSISSCIEPRKIGSIEGMTACLKEGDRYDAILLDSIHTEEHVWAEFQIARQLVCPSGLILVHDVRLQNGTVELALQRIEADGYGVVRLWNSEHGITEDDNLGLAIVENHCRQAKGTNINPNKVDRLTVQEQ